MLRSIAVILIMTVGVAAGLVNRFAALLLYVWFALFRPQEWLWVDISSLRLSLVLGVLLVIPSLATGVLPNLNHPISVGTVAFLCTGLLAQTQAARPDIGWEWLDYFGRLTLVCLVAVTLTSTRRRLFWLMAVTALSLGFHSAKAGVASLMGGGVRFEAGQAGSFIDNNGYALAIAMIIPLLIATAQNWSRDFPHARVVRAVIIAAVPLSAYTVISTFSRGGLLALLACSATLVALHPKRFRILLGVIVLVAIIGPFVPIPAGYFDRIETIQTYEEIDEDSAVSRLHFWRVALDMVKNNPLGVGLKNYEQRYDEYDSLGGRYGARRAVHSSHFQVLAEQGYAGILVWSALFAYSGRACWRARRRSLDGAQSPEIRQFDVNCANALMASMSAFVVGGAFISLSLNDLTWLTFAMVASLDRLQGLTSHATLHMEGNRDSPSPLAMRKMGVG